PIYGIEIESATAAVDAGAGAGAGAGAAAHSGAAAAPGAAAHSGAAAAPGAAAHSGAAAAPGAAAHSGAAAAPGAAAHSAAAAAPGAAAHSGAAAAPGAAPTVLFGDLHQHTAHSDGCGSAEDLWIAARDRRGLDFAAITDHDRFCRRSLGPATWQYMCQLADAVNEPGRFAALPAYEFTGPRYPGPGHKCVYFG